MYSIVPQASKVMSMVSVKKSTNLVNYYITVTLAVTGTASLNVIWVSLVRT